MRSYNAVIHRGIGSRVLAGTEWRCTGDTHLPLLTGVKEETRKIRQLIGKDPKKSLSDREERTDSYGSKKIYMKKIRSHLSKCKDSEGALIWYAGHGTEDGDWQFEDGKITFGDILDLYGRYFFGCLLYIVTNCCFSGKWVTKLAKRLDEMGVKACGHHAKRLGWFLKIFASCRENEEAVDKEAVFIKDIVSGCGNDGTMQFPHDKFLKVQTTMALDTTSMRCFHGPTSECFLHKMKPCDQWEWMDLVDKEKSEHLAQRFQAVSTENSWYMLFLHKDFNCDILPQTSEEELPHCSYILAEGVGFRPPDDLSSTLCFLSPLKIPSKYIS